jgi:hypothetical protein
MFSNERTPKKEFKREGKREREREKIKGAKEKREKRGREVERDGLLDVTHYLLKFIVIK